MKKILKVFSIFLVLVSVSLFLVSISAPAFAGSKKIKVGFSIMDITMGYWNTQAMGAEAKAEELGIDLMIYNSDTKPAREVSALENWIAMEVDGIMISAVDPKACELYVKKAHAKGIPVVAAIHPLEGADATIEQDEYTLGYMTGEFAGRWIKENLNEDAEFAILGFDALEHVIMRGDGMRDGVLAYAPKARLIARQDVDGLTDKGMKVAESLLIGHPNLKVWVVVNDAASLGVCSAIEAAGRDASDVCVVGSDASPEGIVKVKKGGIYRCTIDLQPYAVGQLELETMYKLIKGEKVSKKIIIPMRFITFENVNEYY